MSKKSSSGVLLHFSELVGAAVVAKSGEAIGRLEDVIVRLRGGHAYPLVCGVVVSIGGRRVFVAPDQIHQITAHTVTLTKNRIDMRQFERRVGEVLLRTDVLDHRLIDVTEAELVHAYDLELAHTAEGWVLRNVDTRRPSRLFGLIPAGDGHAARDWTAFEPLIGHAHSVAVRRVGTRVSALKPAQLADLIEDADRAEGREILAEVHSNPELEADVFEELDTDKASRLLDDMPDRDVAALLTRMRADDAADAVADLRQARRRKVLALMPAGARSKVVTLMGFNPGSAGGLMNVDVISCAPNTTAAQALAIIAESTSLQPEALLKVHVQRKSGRLAGVVTVITLLQAPPDTPVSEVMDSDPVRVAPNTDVTDVAVLMADFNLWTIPVVDENNRVLGVVTVDDVLEATIPEDWRRREPAARPTISPDDENGGDQQ